MSGSDKTPVDQNSTEDDDYSAAAIDRVMADAASLEPLPPALAASIIRDGEAMLTGSRMPGNDRSGIPLKTPWWRSPAPAWGAAFASLLLAFGLLLLSPGSPGTPTALELDQMLAETAAASTLDWQGMGDPTYANVSGYVRWDSRSQRGVMQLTGLPVNNPRQQQYQLWIVDPQRDANPVDGGVFNVTDGDNLVAINAKLQVINPKAFAITLEQPGGVVVSKGPLLVIASS